MKFGLKLGKLNYEGLNIEGIELNNEFCMEDAKESYDLFKKVLKEIPETLETIKADAEKAVDLGILPENAFKEVDEITIKKIQLEKKLKDCVEKIKGYENSDKPEDKELIEIEEKHCMELLNKYVELL